MTQLTKWFEIDNKIEEQQNLSMKGDINTQILEKILNKYSSNQLLGFAMKKRSNNENISDKRPKYNFGYDF